MKQKIKLKICSGTACFITGGSDLLTIFDYLTPEEQKCISLMALPCLNNCKDEKDFHPPFVIIDDIQYEKMTIDKLCTLLKDKIKKDK